MPTAPRSFQATLKYRPLDPQQEIRLLEVHPPASASASSSVDEPLHCRLVHVARADEVNYIGLSLLYAASASNGDSASSGAPHTETIHVNGAPLQVPGSIGEALRNMRAVFTPDRIEEFFGPKTAGMMDRHSSTSTTKSASGNSPGSSGTPAPSLQVAGKPAKGESKAIGWLRNAFRSVKFKRAGGGGGGSGSAMSSLAAGGGSGGGGSLHKSRSNTNSHQPLWVWVDALCTDSRNADEMSHRRSNTAVVYREARLVVGWLGCKDEQATLALGFMFALGGAAPAMYGDPKHRKEHPEEYGPITKFMEPLKDMWVLPPGTTIDEHPTYLALKGFLARPFFSHGWILEELAFATTPGFLIGDQFVSWLQILRFICVNEEVVERGSAYFPDENRAALEYLPLGSLYFFLEDYDRRRARNLENEKD